MLVGRKFREMVLKFMGSRNCLFCIVTILRDGGSGVRFTPEVRDILSSYASVFSMGPPSPVFDKYWGYLSWGKVAEA